MQLADKLVIGRTYVVFARDRTIRGRIARKDALFVEIVDADGRANRVARADVCAVLEPPAVASEAASPPLRLARGG